jgi:hypothetical protein
VSEKIEPALTPEEWAGGPDDLDRPEDGIAAPQAFDGDPTDRYAAGVSVFEGSLQLIYDEFHVTPFGRPAAVIAVANAALPDSDPRKITREMVTRIQHAGHYAHNGREVMTPDKLDALLAIAKALESYLPPQFPKV